MDIGLALKLKDKGFPYTEDMREFIEDKLTEGIIVTPSLSELIRACGDEFFQVRHLDDGVGGDGGDWVAHQKKSTEFTQGKTPEEAVANLWLKLND